MWATALIAILLSCSCAPIEVNRRAVARTITQDATELKYLSQIPVTFTDENLIDICGIVGVPMGATLRGCFNPETGKIFVTTIDWSKHPIEFRYESDIEDTLAHEFCHATQWLRYRRLWHVHGNKCSLTEGL
jgi:hypothetical protein